MALKVHLTFSALVCVCLLIMPQEVDVISQAPVGNSAQEACSKY